MTTDRDIISLSQARSDRDKKIRFITTFRITVERRITTEDKNEFFANCPKDPDFWFKRECLAVLESEVVKKILQQDPSFCFRPSDITGCNQNISNNTSSNETSTDIFDSNKKTLVFLFTPNNPSNPEYLHQCRYRLPSNTHFDPKLKTEIFIHGFLDGACRSAWMREMKAELFKRGPYNVILVDWTWGNGPKYEESAENTKVVGKQLALLIRNIMMQTGAKPNNFHLIGHSLGAHIAGFAGKIVKNLRRITALDPCPGSLPESHKVRKTGSH
ncbi:pancreatic lipase-related protein 2 [Caerostris extrusa]|uniref:Pancreatic lipase-related protein 2 n=1 Tax=Caerostris extrusa TaxID=172846 RepID=A0AAV4VXY4_CAEEX|nr:pancreatic lipase-related protein 2 [Caerostris extrusa]